MSDLRKQTLWHTIDYYASSIGTEHEKRERKVLDQAIDAALADSANRDGAMQQLSRAVRAALSEIPGFTEPLVSGTPRAKPELSADAMLGCKMRSFNT